MKLFVVFKEGVYRHECLGIFSNIEKAKEVAETASLDEKASRSSECEGYHTYDVLCFELDKQSQLETSFWNDSYTEPEWIYSYKKGRRTLANAKSEDL